jgi:predicted nucleic acid-binding protein
VTVIADTSPLQYAVEIGVAPTLFLLYGRIVVPVAVSSEMRHPSAPLLLRRWVENNKEAIHVQSVQVPDDPRLALLDLGEREAIVLAQRTPGSSLIIDDGDVSQLPLAMAAWAPNMIFSLAGVYFLLRMRS